MDAAGGIEVDDVEVPTVTYDITPQQRTASTAAPVIERPEPFKLGASTTLTSSSVTADPLARPAPIRLRTGSAQSEDQMMETTGFSYSTERRDTMFDKPDA